jgi:hypothetical protein
VEITALTLAETLRLLATSAKLAELREGTRAVACLLDSEADIAVSRTIKSALETTLQPMVIQEAKRFVTASEVIDHAIEELTAQTVDSKTVVA